MTSRDRYYGSLLEEVDRLDVLAEHAYALGLFSEAELIDAAAEELALQVARGARVLPHQVLLRPSMPVELAEIYEAYLRRKYLAEPGGLTDPRSEAISAARTVLERYYAEVLSPGEHLSESLIEGAMRDAHRSRRRRAKRAA